MTIKEEKRSKKYIIVTNTSKTDSITFNLPTGNKKALSPLEVYIAELN